MAIRRRVGAGRDRTSQLMLEIRGDIRQVDAAARSGLTQARISRAEQGTYTLSPQDADRYARALGATAAQRRELVKLCEVAAGRTVSGQARIIRRGAEIQRQVGMLEQQSTELRSWQPEIVPGLLQTWDYMLLVIEREPDPKWLSARRQRIARLDDPTRTFHQLVSEAVLRWVIGSREVMANQLDHLMELSWRPNIKIGVVPFGRPTPPAPSAFHLYGDRAAEAGTEVGTTFLDDRADLDMYRMLFDRLDAAALHDDHARDLIARIATLYRSS